MYIIYETTQCYFHEIWYFPQNSLDDSVSVFFVQSRREFCGKSVVSVLQHIRWEMRSSEQHVSTVEHTSRIFVQINLNAVEFIGPHSTDRNTKNRGYLVIYIAKMRVINDTDKTKL